MRQETKHLIEQGTREDVPTGLTPRKRVFEFTENWELTKGRNILLKDWRDKRALGKAVGAAPPDAHGDDEVEGDGDEEKELDAGVEEEVPYGVDEEVASLDQPATEVRSTTPPLPKPASRPPSANGVLGRKMSVGGYKTLASYKVPLADKGNLALARGNAAAAARRLK